MDTKSTAKVVPVNSDINKLKKRLYYILIALGIPILLAAITIVTALTLGSLSPAQCVDSGCNTVNATVTSAAPNIFPNTTTGNCSYISGQCPNNLCCSLKGTCGSDSASCGLGCKPLYGLCKFSKPTATPPAVPFVGTPAPENFTVSPTYFNCSVPGTYALTFDDGPYIYTDQLLDHLAAVNAKATFFLNGRSWGGADCIYDLDRVLQRMLREGHQLAHHTWSHKMITNLTEAEFNAEIAQVEVALEKIVGVVPAFFRPPYGAFDPSGLYGPNSADVFNVTNSGNISAAGFNDTYLRFLGQRGYRTILWDAITNDADRGGLQTELATAVYDASLNRSTVLILNHDPYNSTVNVVIPYALPKIAAAGYRMVTVGECLGFPMEKWYQKKVPPSAPDSTWHC